MSKQIKEAVADAIKSRFFVVLSIVCLLEMLVMIIIALTHARAGLTIKTHCEIIGKAAINCTSSDAPWYYFAVFPAVVFVANLLVSLKLLAVKGRQLALCWLWLTALAGLVIGVLGSAMVVHVI